MNQDSHVTQRLTEAQVPIHRARSNMVWHLEWYGTETPTIAVGDCEKIIFRAAQFELMRAAHEYITELGTRYNLITYTLTRI